MAKAKTSGDGAEVQDDKVQDDKDKVGADKGPTLKTKGGSVAPMDNPPDPEPEPEPVPAGPVYGRVPYPHRALIIPEGGPIMPGEDIPSDLIIGREWTEIPDHQLDRVKNTARKAGIKLELMVPDPDNQDQE